MSGKLTLEVLEARIKRDVELVGTMDPYVKFKLRDDHWKSPVCKNGGKNPKWEGAVWEVDVKYIGDDLEMIVKDDDRGKDEKIGEAVMKASAFTGAKDWDEWFIFQHKGKKAGKVHIRSHWEDDKQEEEDPESMEKLQALIQKCAKKKKVLQEEFEETKQEMEAHKAANEARLAEVEAEAVEFDMETLAAQSQAKYDEDIAAVAAAREEQEVAKSDFEAQLANDVRLAAEARDAVRNGLDAQEQKAAEERDHQLAKIEAEREAYKEAFKSNQERVRHEIEEEKLKDERDEEHIKSEISEIANKLLSIN